MRNIAFLIIGVALAGALVLANPPAQPSRSAEVLLGQALHQEEVEGNLDAAIATYKKILADYPDNRPLAAKALLQMGRCYEKLGKDGARKAYERLVRDYADQSEARVARSRLAAMNRPSSTTLTTRRLEIPTGVDTPTSTVSPDGRFLAFMDWHTGNLAVRDLRTGKDHLLTNEGTEGKEDARVFRAVEESRWSPDGKQIAYTLYIESGTKTSDELRVIAVNGGKPRVLTRFENTREVSCLAWSPDGKKTLATVYPQNGPKQMVMVSTADGSTRVLTELKREIYPTTKRFSPDSRYIAYDFLPDPASPERDIYLMSVDTGKSTPLIQRPGDDYLLGWSPDGKWVLFASDRTGSLGIWGVRVREGKAQGAAEMLRAGAGDVVPMGFTRDGFFYYALRSGKDDIYVARLDPASGRVQKPPKKLIREFEGHNYWPRYSPDGKYLAYVSWRGLRLGALRRESVLCIRSLETGKDRKFPTEFRRLAGPRWLPDRSAVIIAA